MTEWLDCRHALEIHRLQLGEYGGSPALRDQGLLESAPSRPINRVAYGDPDIAELGAFYALSIVRNHPFVDSNKRTAFSMMVLFLSLNGSPWVASVDESVTVMNEMAAGCLSDCAFFAWVRDHARPHG